MKNIIYRYIIRYNLVYLEVQAMNKDDDEKNMQNIEIEEMYKKISEIIINYKNEKDNKEKENCKYNGQEKRIY